MLGLFCASFNKEKKMKLKIRLSLIVIAIVVIIVTGIAVILLRQVSKTTLSLSLRNCPKIIYT